MSEEAVEERVEVALAMPVGRPVLTGEIIDRMERRGVLTSKKKVQAYLREMAKKGVIRAASKPHLPTGHREWTRIASDSEVIETGARGWWNVPE